MSTHATRFANILTLATLLFPLAPLAAQAATLNRMPAVPNALLQQLSYKGQRFAIGSAAANTRAIQQETGPDVGLWPTNGALFVADPSLNGVMVYPEDKNGQQVLPYGILAGPNTGLNGPVALAVGSDSPCTPTCTPYLWVANAGNETITYYTIPFQQWNQVPSGTISWNGISSCSPYGQAGSTSPLQFPYGIVHEAYPNNSGADPQGQILQTSEVNAGGYWVNAWDATVNVPTQCYNAESSNANAALDSPSGPSIWQPPSGWPLLFNANHDTVSDMYYSGNNQGWNWTAYPGNQWTVGAGACTEGTAVEQGTSANNSYVFVTTNKGCKYPNSDALWSCQISSFGSCPSRPVCTNPLAKLDFPDFPATSAFMNRLYVPNQNNGTVTSYLLNGTGGLTPCKPKTIYINTQTPVGVAVQQ